MTAVIIATVSLAAAYTGYWFYARAVAVEIIEKWTEQRRAEGYTVAYNGPTIGGFPLLIRGVLEDLHLQREAFTWRGERMLIELQPWNFRRIRVDLNGKQLITAKAGKEKMTLAPMEMAVVVTLSETNRLADATLLVRDLNLSGPAGMPLMQTAEIWMEATTPDVLTASHEDTSLMLSISAADVQLPQAVDGPLGRTMSKLRADLQIRGNVPGGALGKALEAWRHSGGTVDVNWLQVNWGEFDLRAKGTLALDAEAWLVVAGKITGRRWPTGLNSAANCPGWVSLCGPAQDFRSGSDPPSGISLDCAPSSSTALKLPACFISIISRRIARVRSNQDSSLSPSPQRIARCNAIRSSLNRPSTSSTASLLLRNMSRHITGSEAAIRVKSRKPPAENLITSLVRINSPLCADSRRK